MPRSDPDPADPTSPVLVEIVTTVSSEEEAAKLAADLVGNRLVACAQFFLIRSVYLWKGEVCEEQEYVVQLKTLEERAEGVEARIREDHGYETPCILRLPVLSSNASYARWVEECVRGAASRGQDT